MSAKSDYSYATYFDFIKSIYLKPVKVLTSENQR